MQPGTGLPDHFKIYIDFIYKSIVFINIGYGQNIVISTV